MRPLKVVVLVALMALVAHARERSDAEATYALKGPVRTFRVEVATFVLKDGDYVEGPRVVQMEAAFNQDGNRTDLRMYNDKGELVRRIVMKFDGRKMTEAMNYDGAGKMWLHIVNVYNDQGFLKEELTYNGDGSLRSKKTFKRDELGQAYETNEYNARGVLVDQFKNTFDGPILLTSERKTFRDDGSLASTSFYAAEKRRSEATAYQPDGSVANKTFRTAQQVEQYGPDGALQKTGTISVDHRLLDHVVLNKNDRKERVECSGSLDAYGTGRSDELETTPRHRVMSLRAHYMTPSCSVAHGIAGALGTVFAPASK